MKLKGHELGPNIETIIIPRGDGMPIVFKAQAILDTSDFDKLCPEPQAPEKITAGGTKEKNFKDEFYISAMKDYNKKYNLYMIIKSLQATEGLEWDTVKLEDHTTWLNLEREFKKAGFSANEIGRIRMGVWAANCLSEGKIEEARLRFLASLEEHPNGLSSQEAGQSTMLSGVPAKDS